MHHRSKEIFRNQSRIKWLKWNQCCCPDSIILGGVEFEHLPYLNMARNCLGMETKSTNGHCVLAGFI